MSFTKILVIIIVISGITFSQVVLDSVYVDCSFYGPFNKTIAELYFVNNSPRDSIEKIEYFVFNKNSILTNLWLEIDGQLKKAETLHLRTGENIYRRITRNRIDPALITKQNNGEYFLRIFPFRIGQMRRVVIEYYSVLESYDMQDEYWFFDRAWGKADYKKTIHITSIQPEGTVVSYDGQNLYSNQRQESSVTYGRTKLDTTIANVKNLKLSFNYDSVRLNPIYFSSETKFHQIFNCKTRVYRLNSEKDNPPLRMKQLLNDIFSSSNGYYGSEKEFPFYDDFINYLTKNKKIEKINFSDEVADWFLMNDDWYYCGTNFGLSSTLKNSKTSGEILKIECPYLNNFSDYLQSIDQGVNYQIKAGYLTKKSSKIVIEDDSRAKEIWDEELKSENPNPDETDTEPMYFTVVEEMPEPMGGIDSIMSFVFIPSEIKIMIESKRIYLLARINGIGKPIKIKTIKSAHPILDKICSFAIAMTDWKPGKQRSKNVSIDVSIPFRFSPNPDTSKKYSTTDSVSPHYNINDIFYRLEINKDSTCFLIAEGFDSDKASKIEFLSDEYFKLIMNNTNLVEVIYKALYLGKLDGLGITDKMNDKSKHCLIVRKE